MNKDSYSEDKIVGACFDDNMGKSSRQGRGIKLKSDSKGKGRATKAAAAVDRGADQAALAFPTRDFESADDMAFPLPLPLPPLPLPLLPLFFSALSAPRLSLVIDGTQRANE